MFFDDDGNELQTSQRYHHPGGGSFGNVTRGLNEKSPSGRQAEGSGRIHPTVVSSTNRQPTREDRVQQERQALEEAATRGSYVLNRNCKTGARVESYKIHDGYVEYKFNGDHGFKHGRAGQTEVPDDRRARWLA